MRKLTLVFCLWTLTAAAQKPKAVFFEDSVTVGKEVRMAMSYLHSSKSDLVFPDSSFDFSPFRYVSSELFETRTVDGKSLDSVIYTLVTYNLDSVLFVRPYIKNLRTGDMIYADTARVRLKFSITDDNIREPEVKETVNVFLVKKEVNLPKIAYYVLGFLVLVFLISAFFGDWIRKKYRLWKFYRGHQRFLADFKKMSHSPRNLSNNERALKEWKIYLEELEKEPVSTMSTSELGKLYENERLEAALKMFDSAIFGGMVSEEMPSAYRVLQDFAIKRYRQARKRE
ncbi:MAG: hypothetical protein KF870_03975 [Leadbetterella sp.]|nr:hypothetical protein [Leadbetterella sp.]